MTTLPPSVHNLPFPITASMLYNLVQCPHRVTMDLFGNSTERDAVSPFVQLLWERGTTHEREVIEKIGRPFLDLSGYEPLEKERLTREAMSRGEPLIYNGRITINDLVGEPTGKEDGQPLLGHVPWPDFEERLVTVL